MEKQKTIKITLKIILGILLSIFILFGIIAFIFFKSLEGPNVNKSEKKEVIAFAEAYLNKKYGDHNFKVTSVDYDYRMQTLFDYSNPVGYMVIFKYDGSKVSHVSIEGLDLNNAEISDTLIADYYFSNEEPYHKIKSFYDLKPNTNFEETLLKKIKKEFDTNCKTIESIKTYPDIPDDMGKIPTMDEIRNSNKFFNVGEIVFTVSKIPEDPDEYSERLEGYLKKEFGVEWKISGTGTDKIICDPEQSFNLSLIDE